ncbi:MAG TPA: cbb3-type cytochrome c oxidase subunit I [Bryobacteraceae bacterium]|jgi:cytochrome c oxidase subunit I|nr:cbb3-type cytochrome c oxidase subunit I [Bryobacteraceae bacterium]
MSSPIVHAAHEAPKGFIRRYIFSLDHKVIGIQYYFLALFSVFLGMGLSVLMRFHMVYPDAKVSLFEKLWPTGAAGGIMTPELYLSLMTMHGTIMVFFVLTTAPQSGFGNFFLPIQIGAEDMAFPVLNMLSFWTTFLALCVMVAAFFVPGGAPLAGWTAYPPLSAVGPLSGPGEGAGQSLWVISIAIFCGASLMGAINFIATTIDLRARGMSMMRLPLTCWSWFVTAILGLLGFAVLLAAGVLLLLDRMAGTSFFLPAGLVVSDQILNHKGGSPLLWQHLFWFFGHPEVYIAILPGMGLASQLLSTFSRKPIFGYRAMVYAILGIGFLGFFVWGHHMFMSGMNPYSAMAFSILTMSIGVPSAIKTFNWIGTLWGGRIRLTTAMLFALGFVSLFVTGGISGIFLGQPALDLYFHDTYFVVGHFHMIMGVAAIFGMFGGTFYWFPKMFGRMMNETMGKIHFYLTFLGVYAIFTPMHFLGIAGNPRRYADFTNFEFMNNLMPIHKFMTHAAIFTATVQLIFVINLFWSMKKGAKAPPNPWDSTTLEWTVASPPPFDNFAGKHPVVNHGPYEYSVPGAPKDYTMQTDPA